MKGEEEEKKKSVSYFTMGGKFIPSSVHIVSNEKKETVVCMTTYDNFGKAHFSVYTERGWKNSFSDLISVVAGGACFGTFGRLKFGIAPLTLCGAAAFPLSVWTVNKCFSNVNSDTRSKLHIEKIEDYSTTTSIGLAIICNTYFLAAIKVLRPRSSIFSGGTQVPPYSLPLFGSNLAEHFVFIVSAIGLSKLIYPSVRTMELNLKVRCFGEEKHASRVDDSYY